MTALNLVPVEVLDRRRRRLIAHTWGVVATITAISCAVCVATLRLDGDSKAGERRSEAARLSDRLATAAAETDAARRELTIAKTRATVALRIGERPDWAALLRALASVHPRASARRIVMEPAGTSRGEADDAGPVRLRIEGVAASQVDAQAYILAFERLGLCDEIVPEPTRGVEIDGQRLVGFGLSGIIAPPAVGLGAPLVKAREDRP